MLFIFSHQRIIALISFTIAIYLYRDNEHCTVIIVSVLVIRAKATARSLEIVAIITDTSTGAF